MRLLELAGITIVEFNRVRSDSSSGRDMMLWMQNRLCAMFKEKEPKLQQACSKLEEKLVKLDRQFYGLVPWMIGVGLAGQRMEAWAFTHGQRTPAEVLVGPLELAKIEDKLTCLRVSVNLLRVAVSLENVFFPPDRSRLMKLWPTFYGSEDQIKRTLRFGNAVVIKEIDPWSEHVADGFTTLEFVKRAHGLRAEGLISGVLAFEGDKYRVTMKELQDQPRASTEVELLDAVHWILRGLEKLHEAGLVHRDVKWRNVMRDARTGGCVLIDLETVWAAGEKPECELLELLAWDKHTLVDGKYTERSDLYHVRKLMNVVEDLSPAAKTFQSKLLGYEFETARAALDELLLCQNDSAA
ncbi:uncharacterized protein LOC9647499 [Selaginella moellendorffii]|nr:uncharacterized protein LOC9647499 [Selaginella moellendorffii]|eukprot:XP_024541114.1 uncharacterized protein LOC9647499 [Selaginella moellendorffii]